MIVMKTEFYLYLIKERKSKTILTTGVTWLSPTTAVDSVCPKLWNKSCFMHYGEIKES